MATTLARKFRLDVTPDLTLASGWLEVKGLNDFDPEDTPNLEDASAYDTNGYGSWEKTFSQWTLTATYLQRITAGVLDPGQELIRSRLVGAFGDLARVGARWYDKTGGPEAYQGVAIVAGVKSAQTGVKNLRSLTATLNGTDIPLAAITNPGVALAAPVIANVTPSGAAAGTLFTIYGAGFATVTGAASVKVGGVNVTNYTVVSDQTIVATMPSGTAGATTVTVTNTAGTSNAFAYTRG